MLREHNPEFNPKDKEADNDNGSRLGRLPKWWFSELFNIRNILWRNWKENWKNTSNFYMFKNASVLLLHFLTALLLMLFSLFFPFLFCFSNPSSAPIQFLIEHWLCQEVSQVGYWGEVNILDILRFCILEFIWLHG